MKLLVKFFSFILSIFLFILLLILSIKIIFRKVIKDQIIFQIAKNQIININLDNYEIENRKKIDKKELNTLARNYINEYMIYLEDKNYVVSKKTVNNVTNFYINHNIKNTKETEKKLNIEIKKILTDDFKKIDNELGYSYTEAIKIYNKFISNNLIIILIILIVILILLLMVIKSSAYKWMFNYGIISILCGITICILYLGLLIINKVINNLKFVSTINLNVILIIGIIEIIIGIFIIIIKKIIDKQIEKNKSVINEEKETIIENEEQLYNINE